MTLVEALAELDAIDDAIDAIQRRLGPHALIDDARSESYEMRVRVLGLAPARGAVIH